MKKYVCMPAVVVVLAAAGAMAGPKVRVENDKIDLGPIKDGTLADITYVLENVGDEDLIIDKVVTGCGCTKVELSEEQKTIPPGGKLDLLTTFNSKGRVGTKSNWVRVECNDPDRPTVNLTFDVEVVVLARFLPNNKLNFRNLHRGEKVVRELDLLPIDEDAAVEIESFEMPARELSYQKEPLESDGRRGYRLAFQVNENAPLGPVNADAQLTVRVGEETEVKTIEITGNVVGDFVVSPMVLQQGNLALPYVRGLPLRSVSLRSPSGAKFQVLEATAGEYFNVAVETEKDGSGYRIEVRIGEKAPDGPVSAWLKITTDSLIQPLVRIPVFANVMPHIQAEPPAVVLKRGVSTADHPQPVVLESAGMAEFNIVGVTTDQPFLSASEMEQNPARMGIRVIQVFLVGNVPAGSVQAAITVRTDFPGAEEFSIPATVLD